MKSREVQPIHVEKKKSVETDSKWALDVGFGKDFKVVIINIYKELKKNTVLIK